MSALDAELLNLAKKLVFCKDRFSRLACTMNRKVDFRGC